MTGLDGISAQELSELIGAIYDCALDPQRWTDTCQKIAARCESAAGGICVHDLRQGENDQLFVFGYSAQFLQTLGEHYAQSPMAASDVVADLGDVSSLSMERFHLQESRFFKEVLEPFAIRDILWFPALRTAGRMASLHASRANASAPYQPRDVDLFKLLSPHVCHALAISDLLDIRALRSEMLEKTLDGLTVGVFLVARQGHVVYMNAAAERQLRTGDALRLVDKQLCPVNGAARVALAKAIEVAVQENAGTDFGAQPVAIPNATGGGYVATLLPVGGGQRRGILAPFAASVAVFTQDPVQASFLPGEAFARLHGLTGGELRVLLALSQGLGGMEAADLLGVSETTIRTHLQRIYAKTGTSRQSDLLRLLDHSTPPIRDRTKAH